MSHRFADGRSGPLEETMIPENPVAEVSQRRVILISGAAGGIGSATADRFAVGGWSVALTDLDVPGLSAVAERLKRLERLVGVFPGDLRSVSTCQEVVREAVSVGCRLDCLVCAAGVWTEGPADETREADWDRVMDVNLKGLFFLAAASIPHLVASAGSIVNLSSDAGIQGVAGAAVYSASKGAVTNLTRALALELAPRGVRVNAVCPGDVDTPMLRAQARDFGGEDPAGYLESLLRQYPQGDRARFVAAEEVAELIWYLAQDRATPITGANLSIDFGISAGV
jgi:NAD(P)-dependent dehydrogenase (short-subunit alcohol dehydrogenase family)